MTDDLLDEATRLADAEYVSVDAADMIRVLVGRVRAAEAALVELAPADEVEVEGSFFQRADLPRVLGNFMRSSAEYAREAKALLSERDAARGKLDKVREAAEDTSESVSNDWGWGYDAAMERVLAILDDKEG